METAKTIEAPAGVRAVRSRAGFALSKMFAVAEIGGADRTAFLHSQLPQDIEALPPGEGAYTAYLDQKGRITHDLVLLNLGDRFWAVAFAELLASLVEKLERYHIREDLEIRDRSGSTAVIQLHGPEVPSILARVSETRVELDPYRHREIEIAGRSVRFVSDPWTGDMGGHLIVDGESEDEASMICDEIAEALVQAGGEQGLVRIGEDSLEVLRVEGGRSRIGKDIGEKTLLLELGREEMVSHGKGCYLGQETVARVHSRGHVNRQFMGLEVEGDRLPDPGTLLVREGSPVGETRSAVYSPSLDGAVALAMVRREVSDPGTVVHVRVGQDLVAATVRELPLYRPPGPRDQADRLYREGIACFKQDRFEEALSFFERATLMDPHRYDAFESAGICLERLGRTDEAESVMQSLTEMDPENVMAWTNLSRYRAQKGMIEEAEKIKGHVAYLVWKKEAGEAAAAREAQEEESSRRARLEDRISLFQQVLALDEADVVANFGLGKVYLDLDRFEEALPHFTKAIENQKHYSMAYNHLGTCLTKLGRLDEASEVFRKGIAAATKKGDLMPKREMVRKLEEIKASSP